MKNARVRAGLCLALSSVAAWATFAAGCQSADVVNDPAGNGAAGSAGAAGSDGGVPEANVEGGGDAAPDTSSDAGDEGDAASPAYGLFVGTDYATTAEVAVVDLSTGAVAGHVSTTDQDTLAYASGGRGFLLERTASKVSLLTPGAPWTIAQTVDVGAGDAKANPYAVVVGAGTKAYAIRYAQNTLDVIDLVAGAVTGTVDLSGFADAADPDGLVDAFDGAFDPATGRAYFVLQRTDQNDYGNPPDYVGKCLAVAPVVVAIDTQTDQLVDLNGAAAGQGIELAGANPNALAADLAHGRLIVLDAGCWVDSDAGPDRQGRGIEAVDLATGAATWLLQTTDLERPSGLLWVSGTQAYVGKGFPLAWYAWDPTTTALGAVEPAIPGVPVYDGAGRVLGLRPNAGDAGATSDVVAFDVATKAISTVATSVFQGAGLNDYSSAVVR